MIYEYVLDRLKDAPILGADIYPVGVNIDDIYTADNDFRFTVYLIRGRTPMYDLEGNVHHYREDIVVDFICRTYDIVHQMYDAAERAFTAAASRFGDQWIHNVECSSPEPDAYDLEYGLYRRTMLVRIDWSPV